MADPNAKLTSLFGKKKKKKSTTVNANVIVKNSAQSAERAAVAAAAAAAAPVTSSPARGTSSPAPRVPTASGKVLSDLSLGGKDDQEEKTAFQWAKQPKKYKNPDDKVGEASERAMAFSLHEAVASTWAEQQERTRNSRRIALDSERAFPSLGVDSAKAQLSTMKAPQAKAVETKNVWASLHDHDEDSD
ncbi:hypothetical protein BBJ28_00022744 [Nothophytophthora sp. Chile5]|nr:hypothetical protein BBJ28_00022744 [Nothophytophthora sp. Chile5]